VYAPDGATNTKSNPRSCACASESAFDEPTSIDPEATADAIAGPFASVTISTSSPALLKKPRSAA